VLCAGALVAGPDASGAYGDNRTLPGQSGVSLDGNAVLSGLLAGLIARDVQPGQCNGGRGKCQGREHHRYGQARPPMPVLLHMLHDKYTELNRFHCLTATSCSR